MRVGLFFINEEQVKKDKFLGIFETIIISDGITTTITNLGTVRRRSPNEKKGAITKRSE